MNVFEQRFEGLGRWQADLAHAIGQLADWLSGCGHIDDEGAERLLRTRERLGQQDISLAFVAEFSRGKSELINALFFSGQGQRIVPSAAGRTTMCPTELQWRSDEPVAVRLLPIDTRSDEREIDAWRTEPAAWTERPYDPDDAASLRAAFAAVAETKVVTAAEARALGLHDEHAQAEDAPVEIPRWRHAVVNYEHPLLAAGLRIVDTPGLNAIGSEPMLTLNTIPNADAVLFVVAADAGVTRTDIDVWRRYISPSHRSGRLVVLNKIDGLWDELKSADQVNDEIEGQAQQVAHALAIDRERVFAVSAQKALVARIHNDDTLLARSQLETLESALAEAVVAQRQALLAERTERDVRDLSSAANDLLRQRVTGSEAQMAELQSLRGKNRDIMTHMATRIRTEREEFDRSMRQLNGLRSVFTRHASALHAVSGVDRLKRHARESRDMMSASRLSYGLGEGMAHLFEKIDTDLTTANEIVVEICTMMTAMYKTFSKQHGLKLGAPSHFSLQRFREEINNIQELYRAQFGTMSMMTTEKWSLMRRFFEAIVLRIREVYRQVGTDIRSWLNSVMSPLEAQVREFQSQLKKRLESVRRMLGANESLESRIAEIDAERKQTRAELAAFERLLAKVRECQLGDQPDPHYAGDEATVMV